MRNHAQFTTWWELSEPVWCHCYAKTWVFTFWGKIQSSTGRSTIYTCEMWTLTADIQWQVSAMEMKSYWYSLSSRAMYEGQEEWEEVDWQHWRTDRDQVPGLPDCSTWWERVEADWCKFGGGASTTFGHGIEEEEEEHMNYCTNYMYVILSL